MNVHAAGGGAGIKQSGFATKTVRKSLLFWRAFWILELQIRDNTYFEGLL